METVIVVGSVNVDLIMSVRARPAAGETVVATAMQRRPGGKAANQAAAAARAGASTTFVGAVGDDPDGAEQIRELAQMGVDVGHVITLPGANTGAALITVTPDGENSIVVSSGANALLDSAMVATALSGCQFPALVVLQTETPPDVVDAIAAWCAERRVRVIVNNGPYVSLRSATCAIADPLVVNEHEARQLCGDASLDVSDLANAVYEKCMARSVLVTLGAAGVHLRTADSFAIIPSHRAALVVDTTGAGDTFVGTLAAWLAAGSPLLQAAEQAVASAAESVGWIGARPPRDTALALALTDRGVANAQGN